MGRECYIKRFAYCLFSIYVAYCCRRGQKGRKSFGEVTSRVSGLISGWSQIGAIGFQKGACLLGWGIGKWESLEKHTGKLYWNCERLGACGKHKWKNIVFCFVIYTPPFPSWLSLWTSLFPLSTSKQRSRLVKDQLARSVCLNTPKNSPLHPVLCLPLPLPAQRLQAASVIAMCIYKMKHPPPRPCEENK